jgi:hypothetical protein
VLQCADGMCALGVVGARRGLDLTKYNPKDQDCDEDDNLTDGVGDELNIASQLAREVTYINDRGTWEPETPEERWSRVRAWAVAQVLPVFDGSAPTTVTPAKAGAQPEGD